MPGMGRRLVGRRMVFKRAAPLSGDGAWHACTGPCADGSPWRSQRSAGGGAGSRRGSCEPSSCTWCVRSRPRPTEEERDRKRGRLARWHPRGQRLLRGTADGRRPVPAQHTQSLSAHLGRVAPVTTNTLAAVLTAAGALGERAAAVVRVPAALAGVRIHVPGQALAPHARAVAAGRALGVLQGRAAPCTGGSEGEVQNSSRSLATCCLAASCQPAAWLLLGSPRRRSRHCPRARSPARMARSRRRRWRR